jgi:hypothetical protein
MKKSQLKSLIKTIIHEMIEGNVDKQVMLPVTKGSFKRNSLTAANKGAQRSQYLAKKDRLLKKLLGKNESTEPSIGGSYNDQQTSLDGNVRMERDPLNDPILTGKSQKEIIDPKSGESVCSLCGKTMDPETESSPDDVCDACKWGHDSQPIKKSQLDDYEMDEAFRFHDFKWMGNMAGFGVPTDVNWDTTYIGTIESEADGYKIVFIDTPRGKRNVHQSPKNKFKSKNLAAEALLRTWKVVRNSKERV